MDKLIEEGMTIDEIIRQLFEGLDKNDEDWELARKSLENYRSENKMTYEELNNFCWEDSVKAFDIIYG